MKLLISATSPYARKARIVLLEKNIPCAVDTADPWEEGDTAVAKNNPLRKIPILVLDDGSPIIDSRLICDYLDGQNETPRLLPADPAARVKAKTREAIAEGAIDAATSVIMAKRVAPDMQNENWRQWLLAKTDAAVDYFEKIAGDRAAADLDMGDIAVGCLLGFLDFRLPQHDWRGARPQLARWHDDMSKRESFRQTAPQS